MVYSKAGGVPEHPAGCGMGTGIGVEGKLPSLAVQHHQRCCCSRGRSRKTWKHLQHIPAHSRHVRGAF